MNCSRNTKPRRKRKRELPVVDVWPILKYAALTLLGFLLFKAAAIQARIDRGYSAVGGEAMFLLLPVIYYLISATVRDWLDDLRNKNKYK